MNAPVQNRQAKSEKKPCFSTFWPQFLVCNSSFCGSAGGLARRRIFEFLDPFSDWFSSFCDSRNTGFYSVFLFSACLTASFKTSKNLVNYAVLCYGVNENIVNTSVFWRWLKKHLTLKNHGICSGFCFSPRKNTVNNSDFAVFSCFSLFFELRWSAIHGYQILRVFFPTISTFGCFWSQWPTSLAVFRSAPESCPCCVSPTMRCGRLPSRSEVNSSIYSPLSNFMTLHLRHPSPIPCSPCTPWAIATLQVIYIDTEGTFRPDRVRQIAEAKGVAAEAAMDNIVCARCFLVETTGNTGWLVKGYEHSMKKL